MNDSNAPYHAHVYYQLDNRGTAADFHRRLREILAAGDIPQFLFVGEMRDRPVGPHPIPQFELHFTRECLAQIITLIEATGLTALVHPLTDDDLADHTRLARWIGRPLQLDLTTLDPPGSNQGIARFARTDV